MRRYVKLMCQNIFKRLFTKFHGFLKVCKRKTNGGCPICKQLIALCCYHAKHCIEAKCPVPFCANIKHKLRQQQAHQRVQQNQLLRRRMQMMKQMGGGGTPATTSPATPTSSISQGARPSPATSQVIKVRNRSVPLPNLYPE